MNKQIELKNIHKHFMCVHKKIQVLKELDLEVSRGEVVTIVGPSGVGKSTLLSLINGLDKPDLGNIYFEGIEISSLSLSELNNLRNNQICIIFQFYHLLTEFTAIENVMFPLLVNRIKFKEAKEKSSELLEEVGLKDRMQHRPFELSGGEQQRVAIARALISQPKVVLADEPTGNLDSFAAEEIYNLILKLNEKRKQTYIIVTHNETLAKKAHRIVRLHQGKIEPFF